jgi:hypothetical protein
MGIGKLKEGQKKVIPTPKTRKDTKLMGVPFKKEKK